MKKPRLLLTPEEKDTLLSAYNKEPYPAQSTVEELAASLKLPHSTVVNWFHNHRSRLKRSHANNEELLANQMLVQAADGQIVQTPDGQIIASEELYTTVVSSGASVTAAPSVVAVPASPNKRKATSPVQIMRSNGVKNLKLQNSSSVEAVEGESVVVLEDGDVVVTEQVVLHPKEGEKKDQDETGSKPDSGAYKLLENMQEKVKAANVAATEVETES